MRIIQEIKKRISIEDQIKTPIIRHGNVQLTNCPLHTDKNPSFYIYPEGRFHCYSCDKTGDSFSLYALLRGLTLREAIKVAVAELGLQHNVVPSKLETIFEQSKKNLLGPQIKYLQLRGIKNTSQIGYGHPIHKRYTFPVYNWNADLVGFVTHSPLPDQPKYSNSKESDTFKKRELLFNHLNAKKLRKNFVYIVEGIFDALTMQQHSLPAVAMMGTSTSSFCLQKLLKHYKEIRIFLDNDDAGRKATHSLVREICTLLTSKNEIKVTLLTSKKDPAELMSSGGEAPISLSLIEYLASRTSDDPYEKSSMIQESIDILSSIPDKTLSAELIKKYNSLRTGTMLVSTQLLKRLLSLYYAKDKYVPRETLDIFYPRYEETEKSFLTRTENLHKETEQTTNTLEKLML